MIFRNGSAAPILFLAAMGVAGCDQVRVANIMKEDGSQLALALNKNATVSVVGIGDATRIEVCKPKNSTTAQSSDDLSHCYPDGYIPKNILFQQTYTITVRNGSPTCMDIVNGSSIYVICDPPDALEFNQ